MVDFRIDEPLAFEERHDVDIIVAPPARRPRVRHGRRSPSSGRAGSSSTRSATASATRKTGHLTIRAAPPANLAWGGGPRVARVTGVKRGEESRQGARGLPPASPSARSSLRPTHAHPPPPGMLNSAAAAPRAGERYRSRPRARRGATRGARSAGARASRGTRFAGSPLPTATKRSDSCPPEVTRPTFESGSRSTRPATRTLPRRGTARMCLDDVLVALPVLPDAEGDGRGPHRTVGVDLDATSASRREHRRRTCPSTAPAPVKMFGSGAGDDLPADDVDDRDRLAFRCDGRGSRTTLRTSPTCERADPRRGAAGLRGAPGRAAPPSARA